MTKEKILLEIATIIRDIFDEGSLNISMSTAAKDIEEWDSLAQVRIIVAIEKKYGLKLTINEMIHVNDVGSIVELIYFKMKS